MASLPIKDCNCEDFPLCEHADNYPASPEYCDICGYTHNRYDCPDDIDAEMITCNECESDYWEDEHHECAELLKGELGTRAG